MIIISNNIFNQLVFLYSLQFVCIILLNAINHYFDEIKFRYKLNKASLFKHNRNTMRTIIDIRKID